MKKCTELLKNGNKSLVEIREIDTDIVEKYVVCENFNNSKKYGEKWDAGIYYDVHSNNDLESQMKKAALVLYGVNGRIPYERLSDLTKALITQLREYVDDDDEFADVLKKEDVTESEAEFFGIKELLYPNKYQVVTAALVREQRVTIKVLMPSSVDPYNVDDYIENRENIEDCYTYDIDNDDWEVEDYSVDIEDMTKDEVESRYNMDELWNGCDIDDM